MAPTTYTLILSSLVPILIHLLLLSPTTNGQPSAPAPGPAGPINLTAILEKGGQFTTFIRFLNTTQAGNQVNIQLKSSTEGMTVFAPTDNAFNNLKSGALNGLSTQKQVQLVLYHIAPKYYSLNDLLSVSNPVRTQATDQDGVFGLNFTGQGNQVNVSTGVIETPINNALRQQFPLAVYVVDKVLLPEELFGTKTPTEAPAPKTSSSAKSDAADKSPDKTPGQSGKSGSAEKRTGLGLVLGLAFFCWKLLS